MYANVRITQRAIVKDIVLVVSERSIQQYWCGPTWGVLHGGRVVIHTLITVSTRKMYGDESLHVTMSHTFRLEGPEEYTAELCLNKHVTLLACCHRVDELYIAYCIPYYAPADGLCPQTAWTHSTYHVKMIVLLLSQLYCVSVSIYMSDVANSLELLRYLSLINDLICTLL